MTMMSLDDAGLFPTLPSRERQLEERVRELEQRVHDLESFMGLHTRPHFDPSLGLLPKEEELLALVMATEMLTKETAHSIIYSDLIKTQRPDIDVLAVHMSKIRKKIAHTGVKIETVWGTGWITTKEDRDILKKLVRRL